MARLPKAVTALPSRRVAIVGHSVVICHRVVVAIFGPEYGNPGNLVAVVETHHDHAARTRPVAIDALDVRAHDLAALADQEELLVVLVDQLDGRYSSGLRTLDRDQRDSLATTVLLAELRGGNTLSVTGLGKDEDVVARLDDAHPDDLVRLVGEADADHAGRVTAHGADFALAEASDLAERGGEDHVVIAR